MAYLWSYQTLCDLLEVNNNEKSDSLCHQELNHPWEQSREREKTVIRRWQRWQRRRKFFLHDFIQLKGTKSKFKLVVYHIFGFTSTKNYFKGFTFFATKYAVLITLMCLCLNNQPPAARFLILLLITLRKNMLGERPAHIYCEHFVWTLFLVDLTTEISL